MKDDPQETAFNDGYSAGYEDGRIDGYRQACSDVMAEIEKLSP